MPTLTINVVDDDDEPVSGAKVFISIHHNIMPDTWLEDTTDSDGEAQFELEENCGFDISVNHNEEESDLSIGQSDKDITISI